LDNKLGQVVNYFLIGDQLSELRKELALSIPPNGGHYRNWQTKDEI
jgi:hypothetical protein